MADHIFTESTLESFFMWDFDGTLQNCTITNRWTGEQHLYLDGECRKIMNYDPQQRTFKQLLEIDEGKQLTI